MTSINLFTKTYDYLSEDFNIAGQIDHKIFPDGERYLKINPEEIAGQDVYLFGGTISDQDTLEVYDLSCALVKYGARSLNLVVPYFGYSTMERAVNYGEVVTAKTRARLLSSIPIAPNGNKIFLFDLHSEGIPHYFEGGITPVHIYCEPIILEIIRDIKVESKRDIVICSTDAGRAKWVQALANKIGVPASFIIKHRSESKVETKAVSEHVKNKDIVIYDDIIKSGGSLINAIKAYKKAGAKDIHIVISHSVLACDCEELFDTFNSLGVKTFHTLNTHPNAYLGKDIVDARSTFSHKYTVHKIAPLIQDKIL